MSGAEIMSGAESRKWVHQEPTNQPTTPANKLRTSQDNSAAVFCFICQFHMLLL